MQVTLTKERMIRELVLSHYPEGVNGIKNILNVNEINATVLTTCILYTAFKTIGKNSDEFRCLSLKCLEESFNIVTHFLLK